MKVRTQAKHFALDYLARLRDESKEPYDYADEVAINAIVDDLERALSEEDVREQVLREIAAIGLRDADRDMLKADAERTRQVQLGVEPLFIAYDPDEVLTLGDRRRIKFELARYEHFDLNDEVEIRNNIAQNEAFRQKWERNQACKQALRPLDPRTTVGEIVRDSET